MLTLKQTGKVMLSSNKEAGKVAASITAGNIINKRVVELVRPQLPMMVRGYADTTFGEAALANLAAAALIHVMPNNEKVQLASQAMIQAAMVDLASSLNIEQMVDELLDGLEFEPLTEVTTEA